MSVLISIGNAINSVMGIFGSSIVVPVIIFLISMVVGAGVKKSFQGALFMGIGLTMFNVLLGTLLGGIAPYVIGMAQDVGIQLPFIDVGWQGASVIVYANQLGYIYLAVGLGLNLLLFLTKFTDTFQPTDIWNYYQFVFWAVIVQYVTGSFMLGIAAAVFCNLIVLLIADIIAPSIQEYYGYEGVTLTSVPAAVAPFAMFVNWMLKKMKIKEKQMDVDGLTERFGFWGEPATIGLMVGLLVAVLGSTKILGSVDTWAGIVRTMLTVAGVMVVYPAVSGLFVRGLVPLSQSMNDKIRSGKMKRDHVHIALDPAVYFGDSANVAAGLILIPILFFISLVMPGNGVLMLADIPAVPFMTIGLIFVFRGNILNTVVAGTIWYSIANVLQTQVSQTFTDAALAAGVGDTLPAVTDAVSQGLGVASWTVGSNPILWVIYKAFTVPGGAKIITILIALAVYFFVWFMFQKNKRKFYVLAGASEEFLDENKY
ncbi:PTS sugar transporter subunit IIC [Alkalibacter rhizosphaerae]|uniref:PTS sugar transporter subunit IIC n=1 Tax=Alkalibacter rhizosphaerae TaxID=2815577 RepID=A0A974XG76_9FIRM|nr:PTS transporter subunit IIC [Alkalibacter rhizosphaerae]QSX09223.1 PTS sugar transporter subunit IIC [Alkalibacter rhizosphaerae]